MKLCSIFLFLLITFNIFSLDLSKITNEEIDKKYYNSTKYSFKRENLNIKLETDAPTHLFSFTWDSIPDAKYGYLVLFITSNTSDISNFDKVWFLPVFSKLIFTNSLEIAENPLRNFQPGDIIPNYARHWTMIDRGTLIRIEVLVLDEPLRLEDSMVNFRHIKKQGVKYMDWINAAYFMPDGTIK